MVVENLTALLGASALPAFYALLAYLVGSIPFGLLLGKLVGLGDIRKVGSGNIGATNMMRAGGKKLAAVTLLLDALKGFAVVFSAKHLVSADAVAFYALCAVLGHCFPVWLKFKGGKGVATMLGAMLGLHPFVGLMFMVAWAGAFCITRVSAIGALAAIAISPIATYFILGGIPAILVLGTSIVIMRRHCENIQRIIKGEEMAFRSCDDA